ncbi:MAG TPA: hypothetical protein VGK78_04525 [Nocardioides sp.]|uniref:hypothetical protein n=1 Tax=Nocardioides sp. TaxID=35761 RepID=UPI002F3F3C8A
MEVSRRPTLPGVVATTAAGVIVAVIGVGYLFVKEMDSRALGSASLGSVDLVVPVMALDAGLVAAIPLLALYLRYRSAHDIRVGVLWVGLGLVAGGLLGVDMAVIFASSRDYSSAGGVIGADAAIAAAGFLIGIAVGGQAWLWTRRRYA